jgi:hypothetical protein
VQVKNATAAIANALSDVLPFALYGGTARLNGAPLFRSAHRRDDIFAPGALAANTTATVSYRGWPGAQLMTVPIGRALGNGDVERLVKVQVTAALTTALHPRVIFADATRTASRITGRDSHGLYLMTARCHQRQRGKTLTEKPHARVKVDPISLPAGALRLDRNRQFDPAAASSTERRAPSRTSRSPVASSR